jgi:uncharacterized protein
MKCPNDSATLVMSERAGVEIDYCPECRGIWLDRGELDKILDRAEREHSGSSQRSAPTGSQGSTHHDRNQGSRDSYRPKKKEHWLGELFG